MDKGAVKLAPSILAADFARLGEQVTEAQRAGADRIHIDVMDGHFVPNIAIGAPIVQSLRRVTSLPMETHFMISDPDSFLDEFVEAGSDSFLVHWEGNNNLHRTVQRIKALGKSVGVAINPASGGAGRDSPRARPGIGHDSQPGFWTSAFPSVNAAQDSASLANDRADETRL
jgi:ribulose-phosphate 3-epimerase